MIYLDTKHCGYDLECIGFPSVETCMAIVLEANSWLVGWHASSAPLDAMKLAAGTFRDYVGRMGGGGVFGAIRLYGVTHRHRSNDSTKDGANHYIATELAAVAEVVGYHGRVSYFVLEVPRADYVEFRRVGKGKPCKIYYQSSGEVNYTPGKVTPSKTRHQVIKPGTAQTAPLYGGDDDSAPIVTGVTGLNLHRLKESSWHNFDC
ncbi:MAG TPA: hypothetical protein VEL76_13780 [Gemmataceae bacterium]|nr:hypothetical protein [Gemmataceae bacterium]